MGGGASAPKPPDFYAYDVQYLYMLIAHVHQKYREAGNQRLKVRCSVFHSSL